MLINTNTKNLTTFVLLPSQKNTANTLGKWPFLLKRWVGQNSVTIVWDYRLCSNCAVFSRHCKANQSQTIESSLPLPSDLATNQRYASTTLAPCQLRSIAPAWTLLVSDTKHRGGFLCALPTTHRAVSLRHQCILR